MRTENFAVFLFPSPLILPPTCSKGSTQKTQYCNFRWCWHNRTLSEKERLLNMMGGEQANVLFAHSLTFHFVDKLDFPTWLTVPTPNSLILRNIGQNSIECYWMPYKIMFTALEMVFDFAEYLRVSHFMRVLNNRIIIMLLQLWQRNKALCVYYEVNIIHRHINFSVQ